MSNSAPATLIPHLRCRNASDAVEFYERAFGAETIGIIKAPNALLMHAELKIKESTFYLADDMPEDGVKRSLTVPGAQVTLYLRVDNSDSIFEQAVAAGCKIQMPMQNMFWGDRLGVVVDPFGHKWEIATTIRTVSDDELQESVAAISTRHETAPLAN